MRVREVQGADKDKDQVTLSSHDYKPSPYEVDGGKSSRETIMNERTTQRMMRK